MGNAPKASVTTAIKSRLLICLLGRKLSRKMRRTQNHEGKESSALLAPRALQEAFDPSEVMVVDPERFAKVKTLQDAVRNRGKVFLMWDKQENRYVACKRMSNEWIRSCFSEFAERYPNEGECPWSDIGCHAFLDTIGFPYGSTLYGVYRGVQTTDVITAYASEGDLFNWCVMHDGVIPGRAREALVRPLAMQLVDGLRQLHDLSIVHRDVSMENVLLSKPGWPGSDLDVRIIDFGMASTQRIYTRRLPGKKSYQAPELHTDAGEFDAFLADAFAVGVTLYCILLADYPWLSTVPGNCKCADYVREHGFRSFAEKRRLRGSRKTVAETLSGSALDMLEGLLAFDPSQRWTLGEVAFQSEGSSPRRSVWDEGWLTSVKLACLTCDWAPTVRTAWMP